MRNGKADEKPHRVTVKASLYLRMMQQNEKSSAAVGMMGGAQIANVNAGNYSGKEIRALEDEIKSLKGQNSQKEKQISSLTVVN